MSSEDVGRMEPATGSGGRGEDTLNLADPKAMRALAHPVRMALIELLSVTTTLTATQASEVLGESPANCAFHLRTLAKYGFVREAGGGKGRERPWTRAHRTINIETTGQPNEQAELAAQALSEVWGERMLDRIRQAYAAASWPNGWEKAVRASATVRFLTVEEAIEVIDEMRTVIDRYQGRLEDPDSRPPGALPVQIAQYLFPITDLAGLGGQVGPAQDPGNVLPPIRGHQEGVRTCTRKSRGR